jgi:hypothetical protein
MNAPGYRPSRSPWTNQPEGVPGQGIPISPYNYGDPFVQGPYDTLGLRARQPTGTSIRHRLRTPELPLIFHPPITEPGDTVIQIHIRHLNTSTISETFSIRIQEPFGPYLEGYCFAHGQLFREDWIFVWVYPDPQPGIPNHCRHLIVRWQHTPMGIGRSGLPMQDGEVLQVVRSNDPRIQASLQQSDQLELAREQAARYRSAMDTSSAMPPISGLR